MAEMKPLKLITFLGVKSYAATTYKWQGLTKKSSFATAACVEFLKPAEVIVFMTVDAEKENFALLQRELAHLVLQPVIVPLGGDQDELWEIFNALNDAVKDGDEIAMDITNGQRSLPFLALLTAAFMKTARDVNVRHILYGAFDVGKSLGAEHAPIFDLSEMLNLLDWSVAADRFMRFGDSADMAKLLIDRSRQIKKAGRYESRINAQVEPFEDTAKSLGAVTDALALLRPYDAMTKIDKLDKNIKQVASASVHDKRFSPLYRLLEKIDDSYSAFGNPAPEGDDVKIAKTLEQERKLIFWYRDHGYWVQAVSLAREWLVSWVMYRSGEFDLLNDNSRTKTEFEINSFTHTRSQWEGSGFIASYMDGKKFADLWNEIANIRNDIDHAGKNTQPNEADSLIKRMKKQFAILSEIEI